MRDPACFLALWSAVFAILAVRQLRYVWDAAPTAAVVLALLPAALRDRVTERRSRPRLATALVVALAVLLLLPPLRQLHLAPALAVDPEEAVRRSRSTSVPERLHYAGRRASASIEEVRKPRPARARSQAVKAASSGTPRKGSKQRARRGLGWGP